MSRATVESAARMPIRGRPPLRRGVGDALDGATLYARHRLPLPASLDAARNHPDLIGVVSYAWTGLDRPLACLRQ